ncbi:hypothetical protein LTR95_007521 [Oleoguttula sp. CCFEE 5521]
MSSARQERADAAAAVLVEAKKMASTADEMARWASRELILAEHEALWTARRATTRKTKGDSKTSNARRPIRKTLARPKKVSSGPPTATQRVFSTTELLEAILLCGPIKMRQLFSLQRVSKQFAATIAGSMKLQKKMFLRVVKQDEEGYCDLNPLFDDPEQRLKCFENVDFLAIPVAVAQSGIFVPRKLINVGLYPDGAEHVDRRYTRDMLKYLANGTFLLPGSWQKTHITHEASETILCMDTDNDLDEDREAPSGRTMGVFVKNLALVSTWSLAEYFKSVNERLDGL